MSESRGDEPRVFVTVEFQVEEDEYDKIQKLIAYAKRIGAPQRSRLLRSLPRAVQELREKLFLTDRRTMEDQPASVSAAASADSTRRSDRPGSGMSASASPSLPARCPASQAPRRPDLGRHTRCGCRTSDASSEAPRSHRHSGDRGASLSRRSYSRRRRHPAKTSQSQGSDETAC